MPVQKQTNSSFQVGVKVSYVESESRPDEGYHLFSYRIKISNKGTLPAQLISRHWVITDGLGKIEEVRGAGVVGVQPRIPPGQSFEYESVCPLSTSSGSMTGTYQMVDEAGEPFEIDIPEFYLIAPSAIH